jgi:hypothetical protein
MPESKITIFACLASLLLFINGTPIDGSEVNDQCSGFSLTIESDRAPDSNVFDVTIKPKGGKPPLNYIFLNDKGELLSYDHSQKVIRSVLPGKYRCIVVDKMNCRTDLEFELQ